MSLPAKSPLIPPMDPQQLAAMGFQNPFALQPPTPTGPNTPGGFQAYAADELNQNKIMPAMTGNTPIHPNATQAGPLTPTQQKSLAIATPPSVSLPDPGQGRGPLPLPKFASLQPPPPRPMYSVMPPPVSQDQINADQQELQRLQQSGAAVNHIHNPVLRTLAKVGDIAAPFLLGGGAMAIPGTTAHNLWLQKQAQGRVQADTQQQLDQANLAHTQAETTAIPINAGQKRQTYLAALAGKGLKEDDAGNIVPDENSMVYQQEQQKNELLDAQTKSAQAQIELRNAQAAFEKDKIDPNSPLFKQTHERLKIAQQNAAAAGQRAQGYMGRYLQSAYNVGLNGDVLPGATIISDEEGNQNVVGTGNASQASKAQSNVAMFNEVDNATKGMRQTAQKLIQSGDKLNDPTVAAAIADPETTASQWLQGEVANSNLSPAQRDYVIAVKAYKERLQPLLKSAGGSVSDEQVNRLMQMAPGAQTPDLDFFNRQLDQIDQLRGNLAQGVTTAKDGLKVSNPLIPPKPGPAKAGPQAGATVRLSDGATSPFFVSFGGHFTHRHAYRRSTCALSSALWVCDRMQV